MQAKPKNKLQKLLNKQRQYLEGKWSMTLLDYQRLCNDIEAEEKKPGSKVV